MNMQKIERVFEKGAQLVKNPPFATKELEKTRCFGVFIGEKFCMGFLDLYMRLTENPRNPGKLPRENE